MRCGDQKLRESHANQVKIIHSPLPTSTRYAAKVSIRYEAIQGIKYHANSTFLLRYFLQLRGKRFEHWGPTVPPLGVSKNSDTLAAESPISGFKRTENEQQLETVLKIEVCSSTMIVVSYRSYQSQRCCSPVIHLISLHIPILLPDRGGSHDVLPKRLSCPIPQSSHHA